MTLEALRDFCLSLHRAEEHTPFDKNTLVFSVKNKMFCATNMETFEYINVKCHPEQAVLLREQYEDVLPGYYMNKAHWNSIRTSGKIPDALLKVWIRDSYDLVVAGLSKKDREDLTA